MKHLLLLSLLLPLQQQGCETTSAADPAPTAVTIPIQNPSFEQTANVYTTTSACGQQIFTIPAWTTNDDIPGYAGASTLVVTDATQCTFSPPPDGHGVASLRFFHDACPAICPNSVTISQDLGVVPSYSYSGTAPSLVPHDKNGEVNGFYTMRVSVADQFYWYNGNYEASLSLQQIPTDPFSSTMTLCTGKGLAAGDFTGITFVCPSQRRYGELSINLSSTTPNWGVLFDKVSLKFTPYE